MQFVDNETKRSQSQTEASYHDRMAWSYRKWCMKNGTDGWVEYVRGWEYLSNSHASYRYRWRRGGMMSHPFRGRSQLSTFLKAYTAYTFCFEYPLPPPQKRTLKCWIFFKVIFINSNMHHLHHALIVSHLCEHNHKQKYWYPIINLKDTFFEPAVGSRPNFARFIAQHWKRVKMHVASATCEGPL